MAVSPEHREILDALPDYGTWPLWKLHEEAELLRNNLSQIPMNEARKSRVERELQHILFHVSDLLIDKPNDKNTTNAEDFARW